MSTEQEAIIRAISSQVRAAITWITCWRRYKDTASIRCAAFALGRVSGLVQYAHARGVELPEILQAEVDALEDVHRQL